MARLVAVDYDPFASQSAQPRLTPVDYDPFAPTLNANASGSTGVVNKKAEAIWGGSFDDWKKRKEADDAEQARMVAESEAGNVGSRRAQEFQRQTEALNEAGVQRGEFDLGATTQAARAGAERFIGGATRFVGELAAPVVGLLDAAKNPQAMVRGAQARGQSPLTAAMLSGQDNALANAGAGIAETGAIRQRMAQPLLIDRPDDALSLQGLKYYAQQGAISAPQLGLSVAAGAAGGGPAALLAAGGSAFGTKFADARDEGQDFAQATGGAAVTAATEGLPEMLPAAAALGKLSRFMPDWMADGIVARVTATGLAEGGTEGITEAANIAYETFGEDKPMDRATFVNRVKDAVITGGFAGAAVGAVTGTGEYADGRNRDAARFDPTISEYLREKPRATTARILGPTATPDAAAGAQIADDAFRAAGVGTVASADMAEQDALSRDLDAAQRDQLLSENDPILREVDARLTGLRLPPDHPLMQGSPDAIALVNKWNADRAQAQAGSPGTVPDGQDAGRASAAIPGFSGGLPAGVRASYPGDSAESGSSVGFVGDGGIGSRNAPAPQQFTELANGTIFVPGDPVQLRQRAADAGFDVRGLAETRNGVTGVRFGTGARDQIIGLFGGADPASSVEQSQPSALPEAAAVIAPPALDAKRTYGDTVFDERAHDLLDFIALNGGLDRTALESEGIDPANWNSRAAKGKNDRFFGKPLFRKSGGMSLETLREKARDAGFRTDKDVLDLIGDSLGGRKTFTPAGSEYQTALADVARQEADAQARQQRVNALPPSVPETDADAYIASRETEFDAPADRDGADIADIESTLASVSDTSPQQRASVVSLGHDYTAKLIELKRARAAGALNPDQQEAYIDLLEQDRETGKVAGRPMVGIGNKTAYVDALMQGKLMPVQVFLDADNFKALNDKFGHDVGDDAIRLIADVVRAEFGDGNVFHRGGDEFLTQGMTQEEVDAKMARVQSVLANYAVDLPLSDGRTATLPGIGVSYGTGANEKAADDSLKQDKQRRKEAGLRFDRREGDGVGRVGSGADGARTDASGTDANPQDRPDAAAEGVGDDRQDRANPPDAGSPREVAGKRGDTERASDDLGGSGPRAEAVRGGQTGGSEVSGGTARGSVDTIRAAISAALGPKFLARLDNQKHWFQIVDSVADLPPDVRKSITGGGIAGFVLGNRVFVVAEDAAGNPVGVLLHELGVHYGMTGILGEDFAPTLAKFKRLRAKDDRVGRAYERATEAADKDKNGELTEAAKATLDEEALAYFVEENWDSPDTRGIVYKVIDAIKRLLNRWGIRMSWLNASPELLREVAIGAARMAADGRVTVGKDGGLVYARDLLGEAPSETAQLVAQWKAKVDAKLRGDGRAYVKPSEGPGDLFGGPAEETSDLFAKPQQRAQGTLFSRKRDNSTAAEDRALDRGNLEEAIRIGKRRIAEQREALGDISNGVILKMDGRDSWAIVMPDVEGGGKWRMQMFDRRGFVGHRTRNSRDAALDEALQDKYTTRDDGALDELQDSPEFVRGNFIAGEMMQLNAGKITSAEFDKRIADYDSSIKVVAKYSRKADGGSEVAESDKLVALHNVSPEGLLFADKIGGLAVPSIGITKAATPFTGFGSVTLIGSRDLATPSGDNPVFSADAFTQRFPDVEWPAVPQKKASDLLASLDSDYRRRDTGEVFDALVNKPDRDEAIRLAEKSVGFMRAWIEQNGESAPDVMEVKKPRESWMGTDTWTGAVDAMRDRGVDVRNIRPEDAEWAELSKVAVQAIKEDARTGSDGNSEVEKYIVKLTMDRLPGGILQYATADRAISFALGRNNAPTIDRYGTRKSMEDMIGDRMPQFSAWVASKIAPLFGEPSIRVGRKKVPMTLENVVEAMTAGNVAGKEKTLTFGTGKAKAMNAKQYRTLEEIQADRAKIVAPEVEKDAIAHTDKLLDEYRTEALLSFGETNWQGRIDTWAGLDAATKALADAAKKAATPANVRAALVRNGFRMPSPDAVRLGVESLIALRETVTDYFEAKPQRAVKLSEFAGAVVKSSEADQVRPVLEKHGVEVREYSGEDAERRVAIDEFTKELEASRGRIRFSRRAPTITINGTERPTTDSTGKSIHPTEEGIRNFYAWFKDSKVVDDQGRPLVVYHGAMLDVDSFQRPGNKAYYFSDDPQVANEYADGDENANVMPMYLAIENPLTVDAGGTSFDRIPTDNGPRHERQLVRDAKAAGQDGLVISNVLDGAGPYGNDTAARTFVAFRPEQAKSALGNSGTFSPTDARIAYSRKTPAEARAESAQKQADLGAQLVVSPGQSFVYTDKFTDDWRGQTRKMRERIQDKLLSVRDAQKDIEKIRGAIEDAANVYRRENLMHGRVGDQRDKLQDNHIKPLIEAMADAKVSPSLLEDYLEARHAKERNEKIAATKGGMPDGAAGMTTAQAEDFLQGRAAGHRSGVTLDPAMTRQVSRLARKVYAVTAETRRRLLDSGQITQEAFDALENAYAAYVPLRGKDGTEGGKGRGTGKGIDVRGKPVLRAAGRGEGNRAQNILAEVIADAERSIINAEKLRVGRTLARLVLENPNPDVWAIEPVKTELKVSEGTPEEIYEAVKNLDQEEGTIIVKVKGKPYRIVIEDQRMADALKNMAVETVPEVIQYVAGLNRYFSAVLTRYNPSFVGVNMTRDLLFGMTGIWAEHGTAAAAKAAASYFPAMRAAWRDIQGKPPVNAMGRYAREFAEAGGKTYFGKLENVSDMSQRIGEEFKTFRQMAMPKFLGGEMSPVRALAKVARDSKMVQAIEAVNDTVENTLRLSVYAARREAGASIEQAAEYAKNISVNFNRRGSATSWLNALYLFFNAATQGAHRTLTLLKNPKVQGVLGGLAALQATSAMFLMGLDDDDGEPLWDSISPWDKQRNLILAIPIKRENGWGATVIKIPMPYGFNLFPYMGGRSVELARDLQEKPVGRAIADYTTDAVVGVAQAMSPIPFDDGWKAALPHWVRIFTVLAENKDDLGIPVRQGDQNDDYDKPRSASGRDDTPLPFKIAATALNRAGLGDDYTPPYMKFMLDWAPEDLAYLFKTFAGGLGSNVVKSGTLTEKLIAGVPVNFKDVPVLSSFVSNVDQRQATSTRYYDHKDDIEREVARQRDIAKKTGEVGDNPMGIKIARNKSGSKIKRGEGYELEGASGSLFDTYKESEKEISRIRDEMRAAFNDQSISYTERIRKIDELKSEREEVQRELNAAWREQRKKRTQ